jgi:tRNA modification GTPase
MRFDQKDTIASVATAMSEAGIGIIRVSGDAAVCVADKIIRNKSGRSFLHSVPSHTIHYGFVVAMDDSEDNWKEQILDEVLVSVMLAPKSYTGEDTVEINCHGGVLVLQKVLQEVVKAGARLAQPGEFSKRAFLNGRMDLSEAEAVMDVISSQNDIALKSSLHQLTGALSGKIKDMRAKIIYETAFIESAIDDPEHFSLDGYPEHLSEVVEELLKECNGLLRTADSGKWMKEGISTVIMGRPNSGKSSVMNLLLGEERAIVTDIAGTTRDTLEEYVKLRNVGLKLIDTAGIRQASDLVEQIGVERAFEAASNADLILYLIDGSASLDVVDCENLDKISDKRVIILVNKDDLAEGFGDSDLITHLNLSEPIPIIRFSAKTGSGLDALCDQVEEYFFEGSLQSSSEVVITNLRHKESLLECKNSLELVQRSIEDGMEEDFFSIDLMNAYTSLGNIIGESLEDDLVEEIFSRFCMGK